jgi:D-alanyl-D-alanine carboxypeptidase
MREAAVIKKRKKQFFLFLAVCVLFFFILYCASDKNIINDEPDQNETEQIEINENNVFINDLLSALKGDPYLRLLIDKNNSFESYAPHDLIALGSGSYESVPGFMLRAEAAASLEEMAAAAGKDGLRLTVSSAYRSYSCQAEIYSNYVSRFGVDYTDRISARPGHSQHQLGLAVDFGQISNSFAQTAEGFWLAVNASRFGWSLSYPNGYENVTGYSWESWHYRYVGKELAEFIDKYFDGIQQDALVFIHEWERDRAF